MKNYFKYIVAIILIILFVISVVPRTFQNDTFYIIALGQQIMEGGLDRVDHFSWHNSLEYRYPHWLFDIANAGIFNSYGFDGIYVFTCFCSVIFMLVLFWVLFKKNNNWFLSFISTIIVSYMIKESFTGRAQVISYTLFLVEIQLIEHFIKKKNFLSCLGIAIISCIIANIHATAWIMTLVLFLPYIGEYIISLYTLKEINNRQAKKYRKKVQKLKQQGEEENKTQIVKLEEEIKHCENFKNREIYKKERKIIVEKIDSEKWLFIPFIFAIIGAMITPIGITPFTYYLKTSVGNTLTYINEHLPIIPATSIEFLAFSILLIALIGFTNAKIKLSDAFLILGLYLMTLSARRNCYLMIPLCCVPVVSMINDFVNSNIGIEKNKIEESSKKIISTIMG